MTCLNRRAVIAGATALTAFSSRAQALDWKDVTGQARALEQCRALVVRQHGVSVLSEAFRGPRINSPAPIKSVSKTIVAALTGAALDRGEIPSMQATIAQLSPGLIPPDASPRVGDITVENLVTMQTGLERTSGANYGGWVSSADWVRDALSRPFVAEPGAQMLYSTGSFHVLGAILADISGESLLQLARRRLGEPLGVEFPAWTRDPQGRYLGGNEMSMTVPAMVRFGEMFRQRGLWEGTRVLSSDWIDASLQPRTRSPWSGLNYGYGWFLGQSGDDAYALARGYGGQIIFIAPTVGLTVAITSDPMRPARSGGYFGDLMRLIEDVILPVARQHTS